MECDAVQKFVYRLPDKSENKNFIYNMIGSLVSAVVSVILLVVTSHVAGGNAAGIFSLAYSTAQMMYTVSFFEMRNIQVTDAKREFSFSSIEMFRILTTAVMWMFFAVFCVVQGYKGEKLAVMAALTLYMSLLSFSDLFQGNMHFNGYLSIAGRSLAGQVLLASLVFSVSLLITKNLWISVLLMALCVFLWILLYDIPFNNNFDGLKPNFNFSVQKNIFLCALPLFLSSFLQQYIFNAPKYAIDKALTEIEQSYYGYLVMPVFSINLLSMFVFRPKLVSLSNNWASRQLNTFKKTSAFLYLWVVAATVAVLAAGWLLGIPVLELLYAANLSDKRGIFMILLLAGGFSAASTLTLTLLTTMRKQKYSLAAYLLTFVISLFLPDLLVSNFGMKGAAVSFFIEMAVLFIAMLTVFIIVLLMAGRDNKDGSIKDL